MTIEVKVPLLPESIADATVAVWHKKAGDTISRNENIVDLETDKVMLEVPAPADGVIKEIKKDKGSTVHAQEVLAIIEEAKAGTQPSKAAEATAKQAATPPKTTEAKQQQAPQQRTQPSQQTLAQQKTQQATQQITPQTTQQTSKTQANLGPAARRAAAEHGGDVLQAYHPSTPDMTGARPEQRVPMTRMRARIAERLLEVKQNTAMLTTFNEVNMAPIMEIRQRYRDKFEKKYKTRLGLMSFFVRASVEALKRFPTVNASIDGNDIVYHGYFDVGVAVSTDRGLVVPVLRDADQMNMADIEMAIADAAEKARDGKLTLEEMQGGTFTITNGGVFGSLLATPILNAPQCAILGMHKIEERPVVENGQIVIRPMMYVALSYDHRLIDGKESVTFLVTIKELLEDPTRLLLEI